MAGHRLHVFVNSRKVELKSRRITGSELLEAAGFPEAEHWNIYRLQDEKDLVGSLVMCADTLPVKDGDWFRVIQGHESCE